MAELPRVEIKYCIRCRWLLRAAWMAQELLAEFPNELGEIALVPVPARVFEIRADGKLIWAYREREHFPKIKEVKEMVRDAIAPERELVFANSPDDDD